MARSTQQELDRRAQQLADDAKLLAEIAERRRRAEQAQRHSLRRLRHEKRQEFGTLADEAGLFVLGETTITFRIEPDLLRAVLGTMAHLAATPGELKAWVDTYAVESASAHAHGHQFITGPSGPGKSFPTIG